MEQLSEYLNKALNESVYGVGGWLCLDSRKNIRTWAKKYHLDTEMVRMAFEWLYDAISGMPTSEVSGFLRALPTLNCMDELHVMGNEIGMEEDEIDAVDWKGFFTDIDKEWNKLGFYKK